jgi:hypothetical protein
LAKLDVSSRVELAERVRAEAATNQAATNQAATDRAVTANSGGVVTPTGRPAR